MDTVDIFNEKTGLWEKIELDEFGFPLTEQRKKEKKDIEDENNSIDIARDKKIQEIINNIENNQEKPEGSIGFDFVNNEWIFPTFPTPTQEKLWDSWIKKEDGLWHAPVDYPSENPLQYKWDELEQKWIDVSVVFPTPSREKLWDSWIEDENGFWHAPVPYPNQNALQYQWDELEQEWVDISIKLEES